MLETALSVVVAGLSWTATLAFCVWAYRRWWRRRKHLAEVRELFPERFPSPQSRARDWDKAWETNSRRYPHNPEVGPFTSTFIVVVCVIGIFGLEAFLLMVMAGGSIAALCGRRQFAVSPEELQARRELRQRERLPSDDLRAQR